LHQSYLTVTRFHSQWCNLTGSKSWDVVQVASHFTGVYTRMDTLCVRYSCLFAEVAISLYESAWSWRVCRGDLL